MHSTSLKNTGTKIKITIGLVIFLPALLLGFGLFYIGSNMDSLMIQITAGAIMISIIGYLGPKFQNKLLKKVKCPECDINNLRIKKEQFYDDRVAKEKILLECPKCRISYDIKYKRIKYGS